MKVNFRFQGQIKRYFSLILVVITLFSTISSVYASILTIDNVSSQFQKTSVIQAFNQLGSSITSKVNNTDKTFDIYDEGEKVFSFVYTDEYIEYDNRSAVVTEENYMDDFGVYICLSGIMESVFVLSGHDNKGLSEDATYTDTYDTYGIQIETESYNFSGEDENGGTWSASGEYIKYFKISFDTEKISALVNKYGVDVEKNAPNKEILSILVPEIETKNITENSVTIYPEVDFNSTDSDYVVNCFVYRSNSENGVYEKVSDFAVNCLDSVGIVDDGLKSNTTYYYKAIVDGGIQYSEVISVTTKGGSVTGGNISNNTNSNLNNNNDNVLKNPQTGVFYSVVTVIILLVGCIGTMFYIKKKYEF